MSELTKFFYFFYFFLIAIFSLFNFRIFLAVVLLARRREVFM